MKKVDKLVPKLRGDVSTEKSTDKENVFKTLQKVNLGCIQMATWEDGNHHTSNSEVSLMFRENV